MKVHLVFPKTIVDSAAVMQGLLLWWLLLLQGAFLVAQTVKNLPAMQETWVRSVGWEDPLEKGNGLLCPSPGIFLTQESNLCHLHCRWILYH